MKNTTKLISKLPIAKFFYRGSHSHPIRRTILVTENSKYYLSGYELREGKETRCFENSSIKTYKKSNIAKYGDYSRLDKTKDPNESTLKRLNVLDLFVDGV